MNSYDKRRLADMFLSLRVKPNAAKLFLTVYFKRKAFFKKLVPFY